MDIATIDQQYNQLQQEAQGVLRALETLAAKIKTASDGGNQDAREWLLDLRELAVSMQAEQQQVMSVMQAVHGAVEAELNHSYGRPLSGAWQPTYPQSPNQQVFAPQPQQRSGGFLSEFMISGFGRAIEMGAGFGIGDNLINQLF